MELIQFNGSIFEDDNCVEDSHNEARPVLKEEKADDDEEWNEYFLAEDAGEINFQFRKAKITRAKFNILSPVLILSHLDDSVLKFKLNLSSKLVLLSFKPSQCLVSPVILALMYKPGGRLRDEEH